MRRLALLCLIPLAACSLTGGGSTGVGFDDLRDGLSESETLSKHHGSQWRCGPTSDQFNHLGDKVCGAEDFSFYQKAVPGFFYFMGCTPTDRDARTAAPNHSPRFYADEKCLKLGVKTLATLAVDWLAANG